MASPTQWTWVWANSRRWWRTGKPGVLQSMGSQRDGHELVTEQHPANEHHQLLPEGQVRNAAHLWGLTEFLPWDWGGQWVRTISQFSLQPASGRRCLHCIRWNISTEMSNCPSERFGNDFILSLVMNENGGFSSFLQTLAVIYLFLNACCFYYCFWYGPFFALYWIYYNIASVLCFGFWLRHWGRRIPDPSIRRWN